MKRTFKKATLKGDTLYVGKQIIYPAFDTALEDVQVTGPTSIDPVWYIEGYVILYDLKKPKWWKSQMWTRIGRTKISFVKTNLNIYEDLDAD